MFHLMPCTLSKTKTKSNSKSTKTALVCTGIVSALAAHMFTPLQPKAQAWTSLATTLGVTTTVVVIVILVMQDDDDDKAAAKSKNRRASVEAFKQSAHLYLGENEKTIVQDLSTGHGAFLSSLSSFLELNDQENTAFVSALSQKRPVLLAQLQSGAKGNFESSMAFYREIGETLKSRPELANRLSLASKKVGF